MTDVRMDAMDGCRVLRLTSPDGLNRLSPAVLEQLAAQVAAAGDTIGVILTGNARCFSAGADLDEVGRLDGAAAWSFSRRGQQALNRIAASPVPVIAAVDGYCMGGGFDLALACHIRLATERATFGHRGARLGLVTGWGGTQRLPRLAGMARALEMFLTAAVWNGADALAAGLVRDLAPPDQLLPRACALLQHLRRARIATALPETSRELNLP